MTIDKCLHCTKPDCDGCGMDKQPEPKRSESAQQRARERWRAKYWANREEISARRKERYRTDEAYREAIKKHQLERYHTDPAYREAIKRRQREKYQQDPEYQAYMKQKAIEKKRSVKNERSR